MHWIISEDLHDMKLPAQLEARSFIVVSNCVRGGPRDFASGMKPQYAGGISPTWPVTLGSLVMQTRKSEQ